MSVVSARDKYALATTLIITRISQNSVRNIKRVDKFSRINKYINSVQESNLMAFQPPSARQELANRKILEEIQLKKQQILKQGVAPSLNSPTITPSLSAVGTSVTLPAFMSPDAHMMSSSQRAALQHAHSLSFGYFVTQDSSFGNLILPVLPRFDIK